MSCFCACWQLIFLLFTGVPLLGCIFVKMFTSPFSSLKRTKREKEFFDPISDTRKTFPSINDKHSIQLTVVIPAYEEEERLPPMLDECTEFLEKRTASNPGFTYEVIVVNDGSKDGTSDAVLKLCKQLGTDKIRLLELESNRGKGGAVTLGVECARGAVILFADADGATKFEDIEKVESAMQQLSGFDLKKQSHDLASCDVIICGSRAHLEKEAIATRSVFRNFLMHGFHFVVWLLVVRSLRDTQCGFKLFTRNAARRCFKSLHVARWAFDVELLYIAETLRIKVAEVAVRWTEIDGSKLVPVWSWLQMGKDLILIWLRYQIGAWKLHPETLAS